MNLRHTLARAAVKAFGADVFGQIISSAGTSSPARVGTKQLLKGYSTMPWLRACVQKVSWSVATNQWLLLVAQRGSKAIKDDVLAQSQDTRKRHAVIAKGLQTGDLREITDNAFLDFMAKGTPPFFDGLIASQLTQQHQDLVGESLWVLERGVIGGKGKRGVPVSCWVIPPNWIQSVATLNNPFFTIVGPYGARTIPAEDVVWQYQPRPDDPYNRGTGVGHVLGDELETDEFAAKYTKSFFYNDARPPFVVSIDGADKTEIDRVRVWWETKHQGHGRWWKPGFIGKKLDIHEFGTSMQDMQMVPLRRFERDTILQVYGSPPEIFGIVESSNRATADAAKAIYGEHVVQPRLEFERSRRQRIAQEEFDERLIVEFVSPVPEDKEFKLKAMTAVPYNYKVDEHRAAAGWDALPDGSGQVHMTPFNVVPKKRIDEVDEPPPAPAPAVPPPPAPAAEDEDEDEDEDTPPEEDEDEDTEDESGKGVRRYYLRAFTEDDIPKVLKKVTKEQIAKKAKPVVTDTVKFFGQKSIDDAGESIDFNMRSKKVEKFLGAWAGDRIGDKVNQTTIDELRATLEAGVRAGETTEALKDRVRDVFEDAETWRAEAIARTEVARASNFAALEGMSQAGIDEKEWLATQDDVVRDTHADLDGQRVAVDEDFVSSSGATAAYPGDFGVPEEDINCRCTVVSVIAKSAVRVAMWKSIEADRKPYDRSLRRALKAGFKDQETAVLAALESLAKHVAA